MIRFILIIGLFFAVLALSPILLESPGYILISVGDNIIELTAYAAFFWLTGLLVTALFIYKLLRGGFSLSFKAWHSVTFASQRRGIANYNKGLSAYMLGDYEQAEQLFAKSAEPAKRQHSAYLLAAASSSKQALNANTNHYLALLEQETAKSKADDLASTIVQVKLLMTQSTTESFQKARTLLDDNHKQLGHDSRLLALEINLCLVEKRFTTAVDHLAAARKVKAITSEKIQAWEKHAYYGVFDELIKQQDQNSLQSYWQKLNRKVKQQEQVIFAYCKVLAEHNITEPLVKLITPQLKNNPSRSFIKQLRTLPIKQAEPLIAIVQKHLHVDNKSPQWLSCLGHLAVMSEQWSMAEKAFGSLVKLDANQQEQQYDQHDLFAFAKALTEAGQFQAANEVFTKICAVG